MTEPSEPKTETQAGKRAEGFNYCFWSKLLVAIVLFPLIAAMSILLFSNVILKIAGGTVAIVGIMYAAAKIDAMPCFSGKIPPLIGRAKPL